jgi:flavin-binding protein dodecin
MPKIVKIDTFGIAEKLGGREASKTLRNVRSVYIKEFSASVDGKKITSYRVNAKVTFEMERAVRENVETLRG